MLFRRVLTYRLMLYYLIALLFAALLLSLRGAVVYGLPNILFWTALMLTATFAVNAVFARIFGAQSNPESVAITALILAFIISPAPPTDIPAIGFAVFASSWAMASKYILATGGRHIFNPAALGAALAGLILHRPVSWWVGDYTLMLPIVILGGILILQRLKYYDLLLSFAVSAMLVTLVSNHRLGPIEAGNAAYLLVAHSMFFFFAFVMLTEPRTAPLGRWRRITYGGLIGVLFAPTSHVGSYYFTPEVALLAGNIFSYLSNRRRLERWTCMLTGKKPLEKSVRA
jgi:Na+-transporting NADH:ubiquinone oxidoreductase subunit NqrB